MAPSPPETNSTTVPSFVDTNVLVYAEDADAGPKQILAQNLLADLWKDRQGVLSVQVLQEFYVTVTRKLPKPLPPDQARDIVREYLAWTVVPGTPELLKSAMDLQHGEELNFWDALIVQAAIEAGCDRLYSEDMGNGRKYGPVTIVNPFA